MGHYIEIAKYGEDNIAIECMDCHVLLTDENKKSTSLSWKKTGPEEDPSSRLLAQIEIAGTPMHLEAYEVHDVDGVQTTKAWPEDMNTVFDRLGIECRLMTTEINGREYILLAQPFGD